MRTYGTLAYFPRQPGHPRGMWVISGEPHVMVRVKRLFGRVAGNRSGAVLVTDTPELARDIEWLLQRHPLDMNCEVQGHLHRQATVHRDREETVHRVLGGQQLHLDLPEPARPARTYQQVAADLTISTGRLLLTDDVGLGKSMTGVLVLRARDALPALVVTLTHLPEQWAGEVRQTLPALTTHIIRSGQPYDITARRGVTWHPDVLIINYAKLAGWADHLAGVVKTVIFDEAQELRHDGTKKYTAAAHIADQASYKIGLTASPIYNYGGEIHNVISALAPDALGTPEEFVREWCGDGFGVAKSKTPVRDPAALGAYLRDQGLMLGRTRKEVGRELPDLIRVEQPIAADKATYDRLAGDAVEMAKLILAADTSRSDRFRVAGQLDWQLRQATGVAKAPYVAEFVRLLLESEQQVVLFGWHRAVYDVWRERLWQFRPVMYTGSESPTQKRYAADLFLAGGSRVLIMSLRAGAGLDGLQERAHVGVFGELDWSPQVHMQCLGRMHRDGQNEPVVGYFLVAEHGADPAMAQVLQLKRNQSEPMLNPDGGLLAQHVDTAGRIRRLAENVLAHDRKERS